MVARPIFQPLGQQVDRLFGSAADWVGDGRTLSDRIWEARRQDRAAIDGILRQGLATGADPLAVARDLEDYLLPAGRPVRNPNTGRIVTWKRGDAGQLLRDASGRLIPANAKGVLTRTPRSGMGSYAARRLARTEVSHAFNEGVRQAAEANPFVDGVKWNKSSTHERSDVCDQHASNSSRGMGPGEYRTSEVPQIPAHPHCRCYLTQVTPDDIGAVVAQLRNDIARDNEPTAAPFVPARTLKEAEAHARSLGIADVVYGEPGRRLKADVTERMLRAANVTNQALTDLAARGVPLPPKVRVLRDPYQANAAAYYVPQKQELTVNSLHSFWRNPEREALDMQEKRWWTSSDPADVIVHEVGHFNHLGAGLDPDTMSMAKQALPQQYLGTAESVSRYAATTMGEFVAETFVKRFRNRPVSDAVMTLYRQFKGPVLP
jgi:hypothetical protein